jgi:hypothetical protein
LMMVHRRQEKDTVLIARFSSLSLTPSNYLGLIY